LDQTLAAASNSDNDPPATLVQVEVEHRPTEDTPATPVSGVEISIHTHARDVAGPQREVARLEDVLKVEPKDREAAPAAAPEVRRDVSPAEAVVERAAEKAEETRVEEVELPAPPELHPTYVAAHVLREAFWFEQASALKSKVEATTGRASEPESLIQPEPAEPDPAEADARPDEPYEGTQSVVRLWLGKTSQGQWVAAFCLLTLIALVVVLTGRVPRRFVAPR
jgi:hypothetical protein